MKYFLSFRNNTFGKYSEEHLELEFNSKDWQGIELDTEKGWKLKNENFGVPDEEDSSPLNEKIRRPFRNLGCPCQKTCCDNPQVSPGEEEYEEHCTNCGASCGCDE